MKLWAWGLQKFSRPSIGRRPRPKSGLVLPADGISKIHFLKVYVRVIHFSVTHALRVYLEDSLDTVGGFMNDVNVFERRATGCSLRILEIPKGSCGGVAGTEVPI